MGYTNPETEDFKKEHKDVDWKLEMRNIVLTNLGKDGWELVSCDDSNIAYFKR